MSELSKPSVCFVTSHPMSVVAFLLPHLKALHPKYRLLVLANGHELDLLEKRGLSISMEPVPLERAIRPGKDLLGLWTLYRLFRSRRFDVVHTITPKAGLLGMVAAWLARVPVRLHTFTGQVWVTQKGMMRFVLMMADRCIAALATDVLVDSPSQRDFLIARGIISARKSSVLGSGSICGVDTHRFAPNDADRLCLREELDLSPNDKVMLYLGRLNRDKGLLDLAQAFQQVAAQQPNLKLLVVGPDEENIYPEIRARCAEAAGQLVRVGFTSQPERYMRAADVFCLPSYREGFGSSVIEAASCGVPAVASRIYGLTDAVVDGQTGVLHTPADIDDLMRALKLMLSDSVLRQQMGRQARLNVEAKFAQGLITGEMVAFYDRRLAGNKPC